MKCSLCGFNFKEAEGESTCKGCPMSSGCELVKCPNCGFEYPRESKFLKMLNKLRGKKNEGKSD